MTVTSIKEMECGKTVVRAVINEEAVRAGAMVVIAISKKDAEGNRTHDEVIVVDLREETYHSVDSDGNAVGEGVKDGTLYLNAYEVANPDSEQVENHYPEYFADNSTN